MERTVYDAMAQHDAGHWWYSARRRVLAAYIDRRAALPDNAKILEVGCGTGHNLQMLGRFGQVDAVEMDSASRAIASERLGRPVLSASLPELTGVGRGAYDLVAVLDVIEHVEHDVEGLIALKDCLRPGGKILIAVPAHMWMWSGHDVANHHFRRYSRASLARSLKLAGLDWDKLRYFNSFLFAPAVLGRFFKKLTRNQTSDDTPPPAPINRVFDAIFSLEAQAIGRFQLPIGLSLVTLASPLSEGSKL